MCDRPERSVFTLQILCKLSPIPLTLIFTYPNRRNPPKAIAEIEGQLNAFASGCDQLDALRVEEAESVRVCDEITGEERAFLENPTGSEKQATEKLLRIRATRDIRNAKLTNVRKRITGHIDVLVFDVAQPLRRNFVNLSHALLAARRQRIEKFFHQLTGNGSDHGLPVSVLDLTQRSKPVLDLQRLCNWIRDVKKDPQSELAELHSELPKRWLAELRRVIQEELAPQETDQ